MNVLKGVNRMKFVSISSLQKTTKPMVENEIVCVLKNNEPAFYTVTPERMRLLLGREKTAIAAVNHALQQAIDACCVDNSKGE